MPPVTKGGTAFDPAALDRTGRRFRREIWDAVPAAVATAHGIRRSEFGPVQATVTAALPEARPLNFLLGAACSDAAAEGFLAEAIAWVRAKGCRAFAPLVPDETGTVLAERVLVAAGYERTDGRMRFVRDVHPPRFEAADEVEVVAIGADDDSPFGTIAALGFRLPAWTASLFAPLPTLPDWRCYLARVAGEPQACAAMLLDGQVAKFGVAATLETGRRRGCGPALLRRQIEDAAAAGASTLFVETDERVPGRPSAGYADILRAGFEEAYLCPGWSDAQLPEG